MDLKKPKQNHSDMHNCYLAIKNNDMITLAECVEKYGVDILYKSGTLLHQAIFQNNLEAVSLLLNAGANENALYDNTYTPLIAAIDYKHWNIAKLLIEKGADIHLKDGYHNSPLSKAILRYDGDSSVIETLIKNGADPYQNLVNSYTPMDLAKSMKLANMIQTLIDKYQNGKGEGT
jgi:ankyrin repeat protein